MILSYLDEDGSLILQLLNRNGDMEHLLVQVSTPVPMLDRAQDSLAS
jgi:hypothetical protein